MRPRFFWIATFLHMSWPYRWLFKAKTAKIHYALKKKVYKNTTPSGELEVEPPRRLDFGDTCAGQPTSEMSTEATGNPLVHAQLGNVSTHCPSNSLNARPAFSPHLEVPPLNAPLPVNVAGINNPAPYSRAQDTEPHAPPPPPLTQLNLLHGLTRKL